MDITIELSLESPDGIIDCRLEPQRNDGTLFYNATILYPHIVNGYSRSEIYCHDIRFEPETGSYHFETGEDGIHPKIRKLEAQISDAIISQNKKPAL